MHVFGLADKELTDILTPPWPRWLLRLYELEALQGPRTDQEGIRMSLALGEVEISSALRALKDRLSRRLETVAWICGELQRSDGWELSFHGPDIYAYTRASAEEAQRFLHEARVAAVLPTVSEVDDGGAPRLFLGPPPGERPVE